jgi:hypothetical protein
MMGVEIEVMESTKRLEERSKVRLGLLAGLDAEWVQDSDYAHDKGVPCWKLSCALFDIIIYENEPFNWWVELIASLGDPVYKYQLYLSPKDGQVTIQKVQADAIREIAQVLLDGGMHLVKRISSDASA